jgi:hypothetical protein
MTRPEAKACTVELLVVSGCPGTEVAIARIREAAAELDLAPNLRFVTVEDETQARALGFFGSPTVRVEGIDVESELTVREPGLTCRLYVHEGVTERAPPRAWIQAALARVALGGCGLDAGPP